MAMSGECGWIAGSLVAAGIFPLNIMNTELFVYSALGDYAATGTIEVVDK